MNVNYLENQDEITITNKIEIFKSISVAISGFLLGGAQIFGTIAPFGVAFVASIPMHYLVPCVIGTILSSILFVNSSQVGYIILSILLAGGVRVIFDKKELLFDDLDDTDNLDDNYYHHKSFSIGKPILYTLISISAMIVGLFINLMFNVTNNINFVLLTIQVILAGCFAYFFAIAIDALLYNKISKILSSIQIISIGILTIVLICGGTSFYISELNIGVILGVILVYVITNRFNIFGASVMSIVVSIALNLSSPSMLSFTAILIISSFISGIFAIQGKFLQIASFLAMTSFSYLFLGASINLTPRIIDIFFATSIYILLPNKLFQFLDNIEDLVDIRVYDTTIQEVESIKNEQEIIYKDVQNYISNITSGVQKDIYEKLSFASETMLELKENLNTISEKFLNIEYNSATSIPDSVSNAVCKKCSRNLSCWGKYYDDTMDNFNTIVTTLKTTGNIDEITVPDYFLAKCCKLTRFIESVNDNYSSFMIKQNVKRQVCESRAMVFEQFSSISDLLSEIGDELDNIEGYDEQIAYRASSVFCDLEEKPITVSCIIDKNDRKIIEIYTDKILQTTPEILCKAISLATGFEFDIPEIIILNSKTKLSFNEKTKFNIDYSIHQSCFKDNSLCGDTLETFTNYKGQVFFILSDGMGKGNRAAIDSVMTCSIITKLIKAGFGVESSIKLINSSLVVKSTDESLATVDLAMIDLYSGKLQILKAGATVSYIYSKGEVVKVTTNSLPIGILQNPEYDSYASILELDDILLLISDGVTNSDIDVESSWVVESFKSMALDGVECDEIAINICELAKMKSDNLHEDDITVVAIRLKGNSKIKI